MNYKIEQIDDVNLNIWYQDKTIGRAVFSYVLNDWYIFINIGIPCEHLQTILKEIDNLY